MDSPPSWEAYVAYFAQPPAFLDLGNISDLFQVSRVSVAESSNLASENIQLFQDQLLFCQHYLSVKVGDTFSDVSTNSYENLTNYHVIEEFNPDHSPTLLPVGIKVTLPLFCSCPSKACTLNGTKYFITYVWQPGDDVTQVGAKFEASSLEISNENKNTAVGLPILIPVSQLPFLSQTNLADIIKAKHWQILIAKSLGGALSVLFLIILLVYTYCSLMRKKGSKGTHPVQTDEAQVSLDKLLIHGVSDYLGRPVMYEIKAIMEATMNLNENCRIGGSMYKAIINEKILAVKESEEDVTEELKILHKVSREFGEANGHVI